jgi:hypothetical protein
VHGKRRVTRPGVPDGHAGHDRRDETVVKSPAERS